MGNGLKVFGSINEVFVTQVLASTLEAGKRYYTKAVAKILASSAIGQIILTDSQERVIIELFISFFKILMSQFLFFESFLKFFFEPNFHHSQGNIIQGSDSHNGEDGTIFGGYEHNLWFAKIKYLYIEII